MSRITTAGTSNWREAFLDHPGLAVTPENYERLTAPPAPEPVPAVPAPARRPPARVPADAAAEVSDG